MRLANVKYTLKVGVDMIKDNQRMLNWVHVILDAIFMAVTYILSYYLRFQSPLASLAFFRQEKNVIFYSIDRYTSYLYILIPLYLCIYYFCQCYTPSRAKRKLAQIFNIILANTFGITFFLSVLYITKEEHLSRKFLGVFFILNIMFGVVARLLLAYILRVARRKGYNQKHIILVGYSHAAESYIDRIIANPEWGYCIHGILDDHLAVGTMYKKIPVIGTLYSLENLLSKMTLDEISITLSIHEYNKLEQIVGTCEKSGVHTKFVPDYHNFIPTCPYTEDLYGLPVINIRNVPLNLTYNRIIKRIMDIVGTILALIISAIPMLIVALLIKLTSKGPIIYSQIRVGKHNKEFKMYKFRSMEIQTEKAEKHAWTTKKDPRVTGIGKFIRKTSLDELPQLFNILKGEMSLVGPRPERPFFVEKFKEEIPRYMIKHQVAPGLTGWAQINGYRGDTSIRKRIDHDLYYIENWSLGFDFKILFLTIFKGFINKNAY
jgi:Undecaprenyl-phosphate glucose phosphotransferase